MRLGLHSGLLPSRCSYQNPVCTSCSPFYVLLALPILVQPFIHTRIYVCMYAASPLGTKVLSEVYLC